jgi:sulfate adenylyltransferase subunit 1 (EFTu-like GTPase family)
MELLRFATAGSSTTARALSSVGSSTTRRRCSTTSSRRSPRRPNGAAERASTSSLITDGLRAEREQGITIDVAYRYFSTPLRSFVIADTPGTCSTRATW